MALYAIGDVQGCYEALRRLLDKIAFDPAKDRVWFTGDLVNRGPRSLDTLRFVRGLGNAAVTVLGNHDLHLLAVAANKRKPHRKDTLDQVLAAPDSEELLNWLRRQPLLHVENGLCLVHAGLAPQWDLATARACAADVETVLCSDGYQEFFQHMYGDAPDCWSPDLSSWERLRYATNCLTRMRYCDTLGRLELRTKGAPGSQPAHLMPWFAVPTRVPVEAEIVFGHWSTLGFYAGYGCCCLDTGCLWGGELSALRLDGRRYRVAVTCPAAQMPG